MTADEVPMSSAGTTTATEETFQLERFAWAGPDRLELAGVFAGLGDAPADAPVLVIHGGDRVHRLPAVPESSAGPPQDGRPWQAAFAWQEAPEPFAAAELELGAIAVSLPEPAAKRSRFRQERLPVRRPAPPDGARRIGLEAELLTAREQIRELRVDADRNREELARAQQSLEAERERRAGDAERFRAGIAQVRASAEEALAGADAAAARLSAQHDAVVAEHDTVVAARDEALAERDAAVAERDAAISERDAASSERDALREQIAALEAESRERATQLEGYAASRDAAAGAADDAERLVARLQALRSSLGGSD